jgi:O-acetyl-ADP-ribose deacetylase (regulator of RNase III)
MFAQPFDIRINTVNCVGVMGRGIALAFKNRYPAMFKAYKMECDLENIKPGELFVWKGKSTYPPKDADCHVVNLPTKRHWRDNSRYEDVEAGLKALRKYLEPLGSVTVALPALGCGCGGLNWEKVSAMISREMDGLKAEITVFSPADSR